MLYITRSIATYRGISVACHRASIIIEQRLIPQSRTFSIEKDANLVVISILLYNYPWSILNSKLLYNNIKTKIKYLFQFSV